MRRIVIANQKGGVGKTTTAVNLAHGLARAGERVLLIDLDSQGSASIALGLEPRPATHSLIVKEIPLPRLVIPARDNLDVLTSNSMLAEVRDLLASRSQRNVKSALLSLGKALGSDVAAYDFVLVDCAPSLDILTLNALMIAQEVMIPVSTDFLSAAGTRQHLDTIRSVRQFGSQAALRYVVPTFYDQRTNRGREILEMLEQAFGKLVADPIRANTRLAEAPHHGLSIWEHDGRALGAEDYEALVGRVLHAQAA